MPIIYSKNYWHLNKIYIFAPRKNFRNKLFMKRYLYLILCVLISSCYVLPQKNKLYQAYSSVDLGVLGEQKKTVRKNSFEVVGIPAYFHPIKLDFTSREFNNQNFKSYQRFLESTTKKDIIIYDDSLEIKPNYFELKINDKVSVIDEINNGGYNHKVKNYLYYNPELTLVTQIKFVAQPKVLQYLKQADALYLFTKDNNQSYILLYKEGKVIHELNSSELQVFQYEVSSFCWNVHKMGVSRIVGLVDEGELCENGAARNPIKEIDKREKKKINHY